MTRLPISQTVPPKPASATLCELAIAAGVAGRSVSLCLQDFPAPLLCQLWKYCTQYAGLMGVRHVRSQADIRKLAEQVSRVRLALVFSPQLRHHASWAVQMATPEEEGRNSRPALFCCGGEGDSEDDPGATLILRGDPSEHVALERWLLLPDSELPDWDVVPPDLDVQIDPRVSAALLPDSGSGGSLGRLRDRLLVQALVVGTSLARILRQDGMVPGTLIANVEDYALVRTLLRTRLVAGADEAHDPLAADMVGRANVYMAVKSSGGSDNPFGNDSMADQSTRRPRELITRREAADLGNVRSRTVRRLIEFLQRQDDGYERFRRMGLVRRPLEQEAWREARVDALAAYLRSWSAKQIRVHFDRLCKAGMISAERERGNGPWRYALPEDLAEQSGTFRRSAYDSRPWRHAASPVIRVCPTCPPPARCFGQTEDLIRPGVAQKGGPLVLASHVVAGNQGTMGASPSPSGTSSPNSNHAPATVPAAPSDIARSRTSRSSSPRHSTVLPRLSTSALVQAFQAMLPSVMISCPRCVSPSLKPSA